MELRGSWELGAFAIRFCCDDGDAGVGAGSDEGEGGSAGGPLVHELGHAGHVFSK